MVLCTAFAGTCRSQAAGRSKTIGDGRMDFTLGVEYGGRTGLLFQPIYRFGDETVNLIWPDIGVSSERIEEVTTAIQREKKVIFVSPEFPQLSRLLFIDEGVLRFRGAEIEELYRECMQLKSGAIGEQTQHLIESFLRATGEAKKRKGEVLIHPFGWGGGRRQRYAGVSEIEDAAH